MTSARQSVAASRRIVIKLGTAVLTGGASRIDRELLDAYAASIERLRADGRSVIVVSSGAVGAGVGVLRLKARPVDVSDLQAAAAAGQPTLMRLWSAALESRGLHAAQLLVSRSDFDSRERFVNFRNCLASLETLGAVPIVNENDTVATEEISLGDNDVLAAHVAFASGADTLVILTNAPGVQGADGAVIESAIDTNALAEHVRPDGSSQGRGGMRTKLEAASLSTRAGIACVIGPGRPGDALVRILEGEPVGTLVSPATGAPSARRRWIAHAATPAGSVRLDEGAVRALTERNASLLAKGVIGFDGSFAVGDVVALLDPEGAEIGRGLVNVSSDELRVVQGRESGDFETLLGRRAHAEVVHRDNLALAT